MKTELQGIVIEDNSRQHNKNVDTVEALVDHYGLAYVIDLLAEVCSAKADHLHANWQDDSTGDTWDNNAERLLTVAHKARLSVG